MNIKKILQSSTFKKYLFNTGWLFVDKILRMVVGLFVGVYVARYLGPERFGILNYSISFVALFSVLSTLGMEGIVVRNLIQKEDHQEALLGTTFWLKAMGAILLFLAVLVTINFTSDDFKTKSIIAIIAGGTILDSFQVIDFYFQSKVQVRFSALASSFAMLTSAAIKLGLIFSQAELVWFAIVIVIEKAVRGIAYVIIYLHRKFSLSTWRFSWKIAQSLLRDSWPLMLSGMVIVIYMRIDQIMIKGILGAEAVGQYTAATRLSEVWYFIPVVICNSIFPAIMSAKKNSEKEYYQRLQNLYDLLFIIAICVAIPITFFSADIIHILYGSTYTQSSRVLSLHIWTGLFVFLGVASQKWLLIENMQIFSFYRTFLGAVVNVVLNLIFIKKYGICGAAYSTIVAQSVASYFGYIISKRTFNTFLMQTKSFLFPLRYTIYLKNKLRNK